MTPGALYRCAALNPHERPAASARPACRRMGTAALGTPPAVPDLVCRLSELGRMLGNRGGPGQSHQDPENNSRGHNPAYEVHGDTPCFARPQTPVECRSSIAHRQPLRNRRRVGLGGGQASRYMSVILAISSRGRPGLAHVTLWTGGTGAGRSSTAAVVLCPQPRRPDDVTSSRKGGAAWSAGCAVVPIRHSAPAACRAGRLWSTRRSFTVHGREGRRGGHPLFGTASALPSAPRSASRWSGSG